MKDKYKQLKNTYDQEVLKLERIKGRYEERQKLFENITAKLTVDKGKVEVYKSVNLLFEKASVIARKKIKDEIELLVTHGLQTIFEDPNITFRVEFVSRRNQIEADFYLEWVEQEKKIRGNIVDSFGGGFIDIISMILRLVVLELLGISGPLFLDEPGKMLSNTYIPNFGKFLVEMSKTFHRQIILITHNELLSEYAEKTFNVRLNEKGESVIDG